MGPNSESKDPLPAVVRDWAKLVIIMRILRTFSREQSGLIKGIRK